jgi:ribosomal protein S18 acetylase RimI-like enzyme
VDDARARAGRGAAAGRRDAALRRRRPRVVDDAVAIRADAYESIRLPGAVTQSLFGAPARAEAGTRLVVAYVDGAPAATALLLPSDGVAGVYWVATARAMRGRGLGEACTRAVTHAGFAMGARFATLQASEMGAPLYARLGFVTRWQCRWVMVSREQARALAG